MDYYTTIQGDTWDVIAKKVYGSEYDADVLMAANPEHITTFIFSAGEVLKTPAIAESSDGTLPPWKFEGGTEADDDGDEDYGEEDLDDDDY